MLLTLMHGLQGCFIGYADREGVRCVKASTVGTNAHCNEWALESVHTIVHMHGHISTLHYAKQEDGGYDV